MKITPVLTEKSLEEAKSGRFTFLVDRGLSKPEIKKAIHIVYDVDVTGVKTMNLKTTTRKNLRGLWVTEKGAKKAIVTLAKDQKIDAFSQKTK